jgi:hypothetical protein
MAVVVIAFVCIGVAIWVARLGLPFRRAVPMLSLAAAGVGVLDGLGFAVLAYWHDQAANPLTGRFDSVFAFKLFAFAAVPAALLAFVLSVFAWLVFRPIFGRKDIPPN